MLTLSKSDITAYATAETIPFVKDATNTDTAYLRNRIRQNILPEMALINPRIEATLCELAEYARELDQALEGLIGVYLTGESISEKEFASLSPLLQRTLIERLYARAHNESTIGLSRGNIDELCRYISEATGGTSKDLGKLKLTKKTRKVYWNY